MKTSIIQLTRAALLTVKVYGRDGREVLTRSGRSFHDNEVGCS